MNEKIMFLRDKNRTPIACIALLIVDNKTKIRYQLSTCHPSDRFNKSLARHIALGRLVEKPYVITGLNGTENMNQIHSLIMNNIINNSEAPGRARRNANKWFNYKYLNCNNCTCAIN
jgi:hypothetical protein